MKLVYLLAFLVGSVLGGVVVYGLDTLAAHVYRAANDEMERPFLG